MIFDQYVHTDIGSNGLAKYLENHGIHKIQRQNGKNPLFDAALIRRILKNPVYFGKIAYGRRKTEKVYGTRNDYKLVEQDNYLLVDGLHEGIVSEELWNAAQVKLLAQAKKYEHVNRGKDTKIHLLSGIVKCPICGAGMYGNKSIKRKADLDDRLYKMYAKIEDAENLLIEARAKKMAIEAEKLTGDNIYKVLICFDKLYSVMDKLEKRQIMESLISEVKIYEERQPNGQWLKSIQFKLPIIEEDMSIGLDNDTHVETVALLSLKNNQPKLEVTMEVDADSNYTPEERATYPKIKEYVKNKYGVNVHTSYIAQVKRMCGLDMGENYNKSKKENPVVRQCPQEQVEYIKDALEHFGVI